jgi:hypothetical protein
MLANKIIKKMSIGLASRKVKDKRRINFSLSLPSPLPQVVVCACGLKAKKADCNPRRKTWNTVKILGKKTAQAKT